jgi:hypothetical protein
MDDGSALYFPAVGAAVPRHRTLSHRGPLRSRRLASRPTLYGVSDRRILFLLTGPFGRFRSLELTNLPLFEYEEHRGGRGTIVFDDAGSGHWSDHFTSLGQWGRWMSELAGARFVRIDQPRLVYELIGRETERRRAQTAPGRGV